MDQPAETSSSALPSRRGRLPRIGDLLFVIAVVAVYVALMVLNWNNHPALTGAWPDRMMLLAERILQGHLDDPAFKDTTDSVVRAGHYYVAVGPMQVLPYLPLALIHAFREQAGFITSGAAGIAAAVGSLKLVRSYGASGGDAYWLAAMAAFGTLLVYVSVFGNFYYLAQAESFLALTLMLIEWAGRRRPLVLGICLACSFLARPTTVLAAAPFGLALIWRRRDWFLRGLAFGLPILAAVAVYAWFNWARFGSPLESGYAISYLPQPGLEARRALGLFSLQQLPENLRLAFLAGFKPLDHAPFFTADPYGLSMIVVSPGLVTAVWAGMRSVDAKVLWAAVAIVAVPVFLYYGGGYFQYGFRYALDFTPFLIALTAMGSRRYFGRLEKMLILVSVVSVAYGVIWAGQAALQA